MTADKTGFMAPFAPAVGAQRRQRLPWRLPQPEIPDPALPKPLPPPVRQRAKLIVIDPGHGGNDRRAGANGKKEKDVTLAAARDLKEALENTGRYRVHLTRSTDTFIKLQERVAIARRKGADLFISLHADPSTAKRQRRLIYAVQQGIGRPDCQLAARENRADLIAGVDLSHEDKEVANILIDLAMRDTINHQVFANSVVKHADNKGSPARKPHRCGFAVLKALTFRPF